MKPAPNPKIQYLELSECKPRGLYRIMCRNFRLGVFNGAEGDRAGFIGIRNKFETDYLFTEYHYDTGAPFGTVFPMKYICDLPEEIEMSEDSQALFAWLEERNKDLERESRDLEKESK